MRPAERFGQHNELRIIENLAIATPYRFRVERYVNALVETDWEGNSGWKPVMSSEVWLDQESCRRIIQNGGNQFREVEVRL